MYNVIQTEGKLNDLANGLFQAVKSGDFDKASELFEQVTGQEGSQPANSENVWWLFNAADCIRTHHEVNTDKAIKISGDKYFGKRYFESVKRLATEKHGGKWEMRYEY